MFKKPGHIRKIEHPPFMLVKMMIPDTKNKSAEVITKTWTDQVEMLHKEHPLYRYQSGAYEYDKQENMHFKLTFKLK
jgi:hypothetical protein